MAEGDWSPVGWQDIQPSAHKRGVQPPTIMQSIESKRPAAFAHPAPPSLLSTNGQEQQLTQLLTTVSAPPLQPSPPPLDQLPHPDEFSVNKRNSSDSAYKPSDKPVHFDRGVSPNGLEDVGARRIPPALATTRAAVAPTRRSALTPFPDSAAPGTAWFQGRRVPGPSGATGATGAARSVKPATIRASQGSTTVVASNAATWHKCDPVQEQSSGRPSLQSFVTPLYEIDELAPRAHIGNSIGQPNAPPPGGSRNIASKAAAFSPLPLPSPPPQGIHSDGSRNTDFSVSDPLHIETGTLPVPTVVVSAPIPPVLLVGALQGNAKKRVRPADCAGVVEDPLSKASKRARHATGAGTRHVGLSLGSVHKKTGTPLVTTCMKCHHDRKGCEPGGSGVGCKRCSNQSNSRVLHWCYYHRPSEIVLFRKFTDPMSSRPNWELTVSNKIVNTIKGWEREQIYKLEISQLAGFDLVLDVKKLYVDQEELAREKPEVRELFDHPYTFANKAQTKKAMANFIIKSVEPYVRHIVGKGDRVSAAVFGYALKYRKTDKPGATLVRDALGVWTAARMIEGGWKVVGAEKLGLKLETSSDGSKFTKFTSAKLMDYKFAGILVSELLTPLKDKMLRELEALTFSKIKQNWFPLFLTNFILLHTYGLLINQQRSFAKRRKSRVRYTQMQLIQDIFAGANNLLHHFHFICRDKNPFAHEWDSATSRRNLKIIAEIDADQGRFLRDLVRKVRSRDQEFKNLAKSKEYEKPGWFWCQLFLPLWTPSTMDIESLRAPETVFGPARAEI